MIVQKKGVLDTLLRKIPSVVSADTRKLLRMLLHVRAAFFASVGTVFGMACTAVSDRVVAVSKNFAFGPFAPTSL